MEVRDKRSSFDTGHPLDDQRRHATAGHVFRTARQSTCCIVSGTDTKFFGVHQKRTTTQRTASNEALQGRQEPSANSSFWLTHCIGWTASSTNFVRWESLHGQKKERYVQWPEEGTNQPPCSCMSCGVTTRENRVQMRTAAQAWNDASEYGPYCELFLFLGEARRRI